MIFEGDEVRLAISELEADIIQEALCGYRGPYKETDSLTPEELRRADRMRSIASEMAIAIQDELIRRYESRKGERT